MDRSKAGAEILKKLFNEDSGPEERGFAAHTRDYLFGEIWSRPGLALQERSMITCAVLAALGREPQLRGHLGGALNIGIPAEKLEEMLLHVTHYAGWPAGSTGTRVLKEVVAERSGKR